MELRDYQEEDAKFLASLSASACFNEPRTGKTATVLRALELKGVEKILVVCPASAVWVWYDEIKLWTGVDANVYDSSDFQWDKFLIISYDSLRTTTRNGKIYGGFSKILPVSFDAIVLDEAHRFGNYKTETFKQLKQLKHTKFKILMTGTPVINKPETLWALLHFLYPKTFPGFWQWANEFLIVDNQYAGGNTFKIVRGLSKRGTMFITNVLPRISTQRKRAEVMPWLSEREYIDIRLPVTPAQKKYLTELQTVFETEHVNTVGILDRLIRYRQICNSPALLNLKGSSPKLDWLLQYINDYPEKKIIVFSAFTEFIKILKGAIPDSGTIIGDTPLKERQRLVQNFQSGKLNVLLLNTAAGREALTLDAADAAIFMDRFPPVGYLQQAEDRIIPTRPENVKDEAPRIYNLMMRGTYDEVINSMIQSRAEEIDIINDYKKYMKGGLNYANSANIPKGKKAAS